MSASENEIWKEVVGYEDKYMVSNRGRCIALKGYYVGVMPQRKCTVWKYLFVNLIKNGNSRAARVHVLVLEAFRGRRPTGLWGLHKDDDKDNNDLSNLRWGTRADNFQDMRDNGNLNFEKGEEHQLAKLTAIQVLEILHLIAKGFLHREICGRYGVAKEHISEINTGKQWGHVTGIKHEKMHRDLRKKMIIERFS